MNKANVERLVQLLETHWRDYGPQMVTPHIVAAHLATNGVLAVDTLTDEQGSLTTWLPASQLRERLTAIAKGEDGEGS